jgi:CTD kinase subunit beta
LANLAPETILDLLDLYTHHRGSTFIGPFYSLETFINIRITLNQEASASDIPRYALYDSESTPKPSPHPSNGLKPRNGIDPTSPLTPASPNTISPGTVTQPPTSAIGIRGQNGTVRFMLDAKRARNEQSEVERFWKVEEEEYEVEVALEPERDRINDKDRDRDRGWDRRRVR